VEPLGLDIRTMIILLSVGNLTALLVLLAYDFRSLAEPPARAFMLGKLLQALAWTLLGLRGRIPDLWSALVGNALLIAGFGLENLALACADRMLRGWAIAFAVAAGLGVVGFAALARSPNGRVACSSIAVSLPFALLAASMLGRRPRTGLHVGIGLASLAYALIHLRRAGAALFGGHELGLLTPGLVQDLAFIPVFVSLIMGGIGFILLQKERGDGLLRESEEKYRDLVERANEAIVIVQDERLVFVNRRTGELLELPPDRIVGRPIADFIWPEDRELVIARHLARIGGNASLEPYDFRLSSGGRPIWVTITASLMAWGGAPATLSLLTDIDRRKRSEERVAELLREKEALLKEVQHRVKNNLGLVSGMLSLQSGQADGREGEVLREARNRLQSIVELYEMLHEAGEYREVGIREYFARYVQAILQAFPPLPGLEVALDLDEGTLDINRLITLGIIVNEIVTNAMKYAFVGIESPRLAIAMRREGKRLCVSCRDNGHGLPPEIEPASASGLGLKLIDMLASQLGGKLEIRREGGTTFSFEFPL
jgi:PAS domain S-box-containing protein